MCVSPRVADLRQWPNVSWRRAIRRPRHHTRVTHTFTVNSSPSSTITRRISYRHSSIRSICNASPSGDSPAVSTHRATPSPHPQSSVIQAPARRTCISARPAPNASPAPTHPRSSIRAFAAAPADATAATPESLSLPDSFKGFTLIRNEFVQEYGSRVAVYRHDRTGAQCMSVSNSDENKTFGAVFRTPVEDSTGIPHILEHSVLNGSQKYPVKEPFVELIKGSLHTFINAFTYPDRTCYPVASTNLQVRPPSPTPVHPLPRHPPAPPDS